MGSCYFISDLHLSAETPGAQAVFFRFLERIADSADALYILGDFFEVWVGDDQLDIQPFQSVAEALRRASALGLRISFLHGNRDFLLGDQFALRAGICLLADPYLLSLPSWQFVLSHGDLLCTSDVAYQNYRKQVRSVGWQTEFLKQPLNVRLHQARKIRDASEQSKRTKAMVHQDLDPVETDDFIRENGYATFIHGHTHRPACHDHIIDGIHVERWVLSDWSEDVGEAIVWNGISLERETLT